MALKAKNGGNHQWRNISVKMSAGIAGNRMAGEIMAYQGSGGARKPE
jgi:hypothetical protein